MASPKGEKAVPQPNLLENFCARFLAAPFKRAEKSTLLWTTIWPLLDDEGHRLLMELANPCIKHAESRLGKPDRAAHLEVGLCRLVKHDQTVFLEGMRLYPHVVCRTAEVIGPLSEQRWEVLETRVREHRLWTIEDELSDEEFWNVAEFLEEFRELPQPVLDYLELGRSRETAPMKDFKASLKRFVLRQKLEKIRSFTYESLRVHQPERVIPLRPTL